ncbi:MAG: GGDEF domain-containing protein [Gemmatimonadetes bacterium]|nr:GGDEF domain-containing protein [Gemmatimonadota bacterium]
MPRSLFRRRSSRVLALAPLLAAVLASSPAAPLEGQIPRQAERAAVAAVATPPARTGDSLPDMPADSELVGLTGVARARALAKRVDAEKNDRPAEAVRHGREALAILAKRPDPATHVATLNEMGWALMTLSRYQDAIIHLNLGLAIADSSGDQRGKARAYSNLGTLAQRRGDPEVAVERFTRALEIQRRLGHARDVANSLNNLGFVYSTDLAEYAQALELHQEALETREQLGDSSAIALSLNNIGIVHARLRQHDLALSYLERALALRRALGERARIAATLNNIADTWEEKGDFARALVAHRESFVLRREINDPSALAQSHRSLGVAFQALGARDSARVHLAEAARLGDSTGDQGLIVRNLLALATLEQVEGRHAQAEALSRRALSIGEGMGAREMVRRALQSLADAQEAGGDYRGALATHRRFKAVSDSIFTDGTGRRVSGLERRYAAVRRERELERLQRQEAESAMTTQRRTVQRNSFAALALLLALALWVLHRRRTEKAQLAETLSVTDPLTGVPNRRYVQRTVPGDVAAALRRHRSVPLGEVARDADIVFLLIDIDHFKRVNDTYGHAAGDRLLENVAKQLSAVVRESDVVARWGGEEFLVVYRFTNRDRVAELAERIRAKIESLETVLPGGAVIKVTCSIGFAAFPFTRSAPESVGWEGIVSIADLAAYAAKRSGRNCWATFRAATTETGDASMNDVTLAEIDARVAERRVVLETSSGVHQTPGALDEADEPTAF